MEARTLVLGMLVFALPTVAADDPPPATVPPAPGAPPEAAGAEPAAANATEEPSVPDAEVQPEAEGTVENATQLDSLTPGTNPPIPTSYAALPDVCTTASSDGGGGFTSRSAALPENSGGDRTSSNSDVALPQSVLPGGPASPAGLVIGGTVLGLVVGLGGGLFGAQARHGNSAPLRVRGETSLPRVRPALPPEPAPPAPASHPLDPATLFERAVEEVRTGSESRGLLRLERALRIDPGLVLRVLEEPNLADLRERAEVQRLLRRYHEDQQRRLWTGYA